MIAAPSSRAIRKTRSSTSSASSAITSCIGAAPALRPGDTVEVRSGAVFVNGKALSEPYVPDAYRDQISMLPKTVGQNEYFVLGDHRSSSNDSRTWGTVPRNYIYGKAVFVYWPLDRLGVLH